MKKGLFLFVLSIICTMTFAQNTKPQWNKVFSDRPETFKTQLVSSSENSIKVNIQVPGFYTTTVTTPRGEANIISMPKAVSTAHAGEPAVPMTGIPVMIGDKARMDVRVIDAQYMDFQGIEVAPSKGDFSRTIDPETVPYTYGECYSQDAFFPASNLNLYEPYIIRDFRGQNMAVYPFAYNPVAKTLRVYYNLTVEMYKVDNNGKNVIENRRSNVVKMSQDFKSMYQRHFINYEAGMAKYTPVDDEGDLLIICYDSFISSMTDFVNWKRTRGINTTIVGTSTVASSLTYSNIQSYIQSQYNANNNLTHVLLVGDVDQIPGYTYSGASGYEGKGDNPYGQIVGNDIYNDVFIGRFSANTADQVTTQVNRTITYERDLTTAASWCQNGLGVSKNEGGSGHNGEDDYQHMEVIRTDLLDFGYSTVYQDYYGASGYPSTSTTTISDHINSGVGIINYCNHGSQTAWQSHNYTNSHVNALTNDNKLPFVFSVACYNGQYDYSSDCFGEAWLHATNGSNPTGAIGGTFSYISQPWIPPMWAQDEFVDIITESYSNNIKHTFGGAAVNGMMGIFDNYSTTTAQAVGTYQAWIVFGDPSLTIRTKTPQTMTVNHEDVMPMGSTSFQVNVSNGNGAVATLTDANHNILGKATVNNGIANISITGTPNPGEELTLCVFGYNKVTYLGTVTVIALNGPYITLDSYTPTEAHVGDNTNLTLTFKNLGTSATTGNTTVTLTSGDDNVTILSDPKTFGALAADATTTVEGFSFKIAEGIADGTVVTLHYSASNGDEIWEGNINITAAEAVLEYQNMAWNGGFTPGETLTLTAKFKNTGHYQATNATIELTTTSDNYVTINTQPITGITVEAGQEVTYDFSVTIAANCPETAVLPVTFMMTADGGLTATGTENLKNACNVIFNLADSYGDGWNGAALVVSFDDGSESQSLTVSNGNSAEYVLEIGNGTHVTLTWTSGSYDGECTFNVQYEDDLVIFQQTSRPTAGVLYEFDCNCAAASQTFNVTVESENTEHGTVSGGGEYSFGESCTVTATPAEGYYFTGWLEDGEPVEGAGASYTFIVNSDMSLVATFAEGLLIGDGGSTTDQYLPSYSYYSYTLSQQIYTAEELGSAGLVSSIAFFNGGETKTRTYDVYLVSTTKSEFTGATDWVTVTSDNLVYSGSVEMTANDWTTIEFSNPFVYDGVSNVVLVVDDNTGSYSQGMPCSVFAAPSQALRVYSDGTNYNPFAPSSYSGTVMNVKNQLMVTKSPLDGCVNAAPAGVEVSDITSSAATVSWTGFSESYNVMLGVSSTVTLVDEDFANAIPTDWTNDATYPWTIVDGHMESGNAGVSSSTSSISLSANFLVDGTVEFDAECMGEGTSTYWDHCDFYIDEERMIYAGANISGWNHYSFEVPAGEHTFTWSYTKDTSVDPTGDYFAVDNVVMMSVDLSWDEPVAVEDAEYVFTGLNPETDYCVKVQGVCDGTESAWSGIVIFTTAEGPQVSTFNLPITAYTDNSGYYLIASPVGDVEVENVTNLLANSFDLYYFDQSKDKEWVNYKQGEGNNPGFTTLELGKGYLYANSKNDTLTFTGTPISSDEPVEIELVKIANAEFSGINLIGNPFAEEAYLVGEDGTGQAYYRLDPTDNIFKAVDDNSAIAAMEGVLYSTVTDGTSVWFSTTTPNTEKSNLNITVSQGRGMVDNAIVRFGEGNTLKKFSFNNNSTKVYIPQNGDDYAVVNASEMGEMPVNFKAEKNGSYNLSFTTKNVEFNYLHLIDNLTGADIDLLVQPSYSFEAKTSDYASRFKLVFATGNASDDNFAFYCNGNLIINNTGDATLQVVDVIGRVISSQNINGSENVRINVNSGVYMLRLINGNNTRTQKIVVR